ncbi:hypothetical protein GCM10023185_07210 [Hymenobacter saemangeumensis]|uniref:Secretion system C-terminal sorting domain-containing protein n=1 Tax=Hymenobacter saemangeumensis TaxID=1084522 RepID=A0ABP8I2K0_9BACT
MKKTLLSLGLLGLVGSAQAQWVAVNQNNVQTPPNYNITHVHTVSPTVMWGVAEEAVANSTATTFVKTNNAAGTDFDFNAVTGTTGFQVANIFGLTDQTALAAQFGNGGEILRTVDGGNSWRKVTTVTQFAGSQGGFANFVAMFDANEGVSFGDPVGGNFEILRTTNGGTSWTRVPNSSLNMTPLTADEYGVVNSFFVLGNTIWAGSSHVAGTTPLVGRIFKSNDRGLTWNAYNTPLMGGVSHIAFTDAMNGIASIGVNLARTTDGGITWTSITPANNANGRFYWFSIDAVPGTRNFISVGGALASMNTASDFGSSYSSDGINWRDIDRSSPGNVNIYFAVDAISNNNAYAGGRSNAMSGAGGIYRWGGAVLTPTRTLGTGNAALQKSLSVYPNPSANGVFKLTIGETLKTGASVRVVDALGRQVLSQELSATNIAAQSVNLDLSKEKAGVYTLQVRTESGVAQQKLVIE